MVKRELLPLPRPISLKNESIETIQRFWPDGPMSPVVHDTVKGSVAHVQPPAASVRRSGERPVPGWVVLPRFASGHSTLLEPLSKAAAFMQLADNAFNYSVHGRGGFETLAELITASACYRFTYGGSLQDAVRAFDQLTERR